MKELCIKLVIWKSLHSVC